MTITISAMDARKQFGDMLNRVALRHDDFLIERNGRPLAVVIPLEEYEQMKALRREAALRGLGQTLATMRQQEPHSMSDEEVMSLANEAKHQTRSAGA